MSAEVAPWTAQPKGPARVWVEYEKLTGRPTTALPLEVNLAFMTTDPMRVVAGPVQVIDVAARPGVVVNTVGALEATNAPLPANDAVIVV